MGFREGL
jgi:hypothetical protein